MSTRKLSPTRALQWLGFRQTIRGAIIIGLLSGMMLSMQGYLYVQLYPDKKAQLEFAQSLSAAPQLGFLYGEANNLYAGPNGYMVYRAVQTLSLIASVWGIMVVTRLLRGNEENGRWEVIRSGAVTTFKATSLILTGFLYAWLIAFAISTLVTIGVGRIPELELPVEAAALANLAIFLPGLLWAAVGIFVSQLAISRRRALIYGLLPMIGLYLLRGLGNTNPDFHFLLSYNPFGWTDLISPVVNSQPGWLAAFGGVIALFISAGILLARRDLGLGILPERQNVRSYPYLLKNSWQLTLRQNIWVFAIWALGILLMTSIVASIVDVAAQATADSPQLAASIQTLAGNKDDLEIAYLSAGFVFVAMALMALATTMIGSVRNDEAKQYLDTILTQPQRRSTWLIGRLLLAVIVCLVIALLSGFVTYIFALRHDLNLEITKVLVNSTAIIGTVGFLLGIGALVYGVLPRLVVAVLSVVIGWSFLIDVIKSVAQLDEVLVQSSLFHYMNFNLSEWPDWDTFAWLIGLGIAMAAIGVWRFNKRDIVSE